jgi:hypothetical protein
MEELFEFRLRPAVSIPLFPVKAFLGSAYNLESLVDIISLIHAFEVQDIEKSEFAALVGTSCSVRHWRLNAFPPPAPIRRAASHNAPGFLLNNPVWPR